MAILNMEDPLEKGSRGTEICSLSGQAMKMITVPTKPLTVVDTNGLLLELIGQ